MWRASDEAFPAADPQGQQIVGKMNILHTERDILHQKGFKLLSQINGNVINGCDFLSFIASLRGAHSVYSRLAPEILARPLPLRRMFYQSADCEQCHTLYLQEIGDENCFT
jgi:hypothetical protein